MFAPLQYHFRLGNTQYFGFWPIHSIFTPPSLPSHLYLVNILLMCGMTEHIIYSWGNEGPSSVFRIKRIMIWGLWWWCDDQKNSCTVRLGFGFNSTVYRIVLQKMRLNWCGKTNVVELKNDRKLPCLPSLFWFWHFSVNSSINISFIIKRFNLLWTRKDIVDVNETALYERKYYAKTCCT